MSVYVYRSEKLGSHGQNIDVARDCTQTELFSTSAEDPEIKGDEWLALEDDYRTLPIGQIVADIPRFDAFRV